MGDKKPSEFPPLLKRGLGELPITMPTNIIISASESDSNLYYATHFMVPDPILFLEHKGKKHLVLSDLEIDRARASSTVHHVHSQSDLARTLKKSKSNLTSYSRIADILLKKWKVKDITVPASFPAEQFVSFKKLGYKITVKPDPFYEARLIKSEFEKNAIKEAARSVDAAFKAAVRVLQKSTIKGKYIYLGKERVTSEMLRNIVDSHLMSLGAVAFHTIVASGVQGSYPHHGGSGPILAHTPIIFDIFPRSATSHYWADQTRTVLKGRATDTVKKMFEAVCEANKRATETVKAGVTGSAIHAVASECLESYGFKTGKIDGRMQGYIHSTGHGLGLDIHEPPSVSTRGGALAAGTIITIEPGLYYEKHGGIRIEDDIYVTKKGYERLTVSPKFLEVDNAKF